MEAEPTLFADLLHMVRFGKHLLPVSFIAFKSSPLPHIGVLLPATNPEAALSILARVAQSLSEVLAEPEALLDLMASAPVDLLLSRLILLSVRRETGKE